jgi:hypothetical protein
MEFDIQRVEFSNWHDGIRQSRGGIWQLTGWNSAAITDMVIPQSDVLGCGISSPRLPNSRPHDCQFFGLCTLAVVSLRRLPFATSGFLWALLVRRPKSPKHLNYSETALMPMAWWANRLARPFAGIITSFVLSERNQFFHRFTYDAKSLIHCTARA